MPKRSSLRVRNFVRFNPGRQMIQRDSLRHRQRSVHIILHHASAERQMNVEQSDGQGRAAGRWP
eukprot:6052970-Pleurochrysis_carterae.AAC.1